MAPRKITTTEVRKLTQSAKQQRKAQLLWDTELRGFGCRAAPSGHASWIIQKWQGGKDGGSRRDTFADVASLPVDKARKRAGELLNAFDPDRKRKEREAARKALNAEKLGDVVDLYLKRHAKPGSYWIEVKRKFDVEIVPKLGKSTRVDALTKSDLRALIEAKEDKGHNEAARSLFACLRPLLKWCISRGIIETSPLDALSPPKPTEARDRVLSDDEIKAFWSACGVPTTDTRKQDEKWIFGELYRLLLLTAQRRDEVSGMCWSEISTKDATWIIPAERTKNGKQHLVHLSRDTLRILEGIPKFEKCDLVFTSNGKTPLSGYSHAKARLDDLMKPAKPWRLHDLRRTAASGMARLGFAPHIVERVLNHVSGAQGGLVGVYQRHEYIEERRAAIHAWASLIERLISQEQLSRNVVQLRQI